MFSRTLYKKKRVRMTLSNGTDTSIDDDTSSQTSDYPTTIVSTKKRHLETRKLRSKRLNAAFGLKASVDEKSAESNQVFEI